MIPAPTLHRTDVQQIVSQQPVLAFANHQARTLRYVRKSSLGAKGSHTLSTRLEAHSHGSDRAEVYEPTWLVRLMHFKPRQYQVGMDKSMRWALRQGDVLSHSNRLLHHHGSRLMPFVQRRRTFGKAGDEILRPYRVCFRYA